jgi:hypothetical protein
VETSKGADGQAGVSARSVEMSYEIGHIVGTYTADNPHNRNNSRCSGRTVDRDVLGDVPRLGLVFSIDRDLIRCGRDVPALALQRATHIGPLLLVVAVSHVTWRTETLASASALVESRLVREQNSSFVMLWYVKLTSWTTTATRWRKTRHDVRNMTHATYGKTTCNMTRVHGSAA